MKWAEWIWLPMDVMLTNARISTMKLKGWKHLSQHQPSHEQELRGFYLLWAASAIAGDFVGWNQQQWMLQRGTSSQWFPECSLPEATCGCQATALPLFFSGVRLVKSACRPSQWMQSFVVPVSSCGRRYSLMNLILVNGEITILLFWTFTR